jgi:D-glycero-D-manno-heptose 1,7-bisphosphate phosphatase
MCHGPVLPEPAVSRAVFLDRDGVLNRAEVIDGKPYAPRVPGAFRLLPNAAKSVGLLKRLGFKVVVVTNQPDVAKKLIAPGDLELMNHRLYTELGVDSVKVCVHGQAEGCSCRKPKAGMLLQAATELGLSLQRSYMVGDRWSDIEAGRAAGCYTIKIERGYADERPTRPDHVASSLGTAVRHIFQREKHHART